jgi:hypothetical protein
MKKIILPAMLLFFFLVFMGCLPTVDVTKTWKNTEALNSNASHHSIFIAALTSNVEAKKKLESRLAAEAKKRGLKVVTGMEVFGPPGSPGIDTARAAILDKIRATGATAAFTVALVDVGDENHYVPGSGSYGTAFSSYFDSFGNYYRRTDLVVNSPGYYADEKMYYLESNLYDVTTEKLLWSAQSESATPDGLNSLSKNFTKAMIMQMEKDGVIKK